MELTVFDDAAARVENPGVNWTDQTATVLSPISLECDLKRVPAREEFRRECDRLKTVPAIKRWLEGLT